ncbi:rhomboid family intramembrane serine protease [Halobacillus seohaensis]|uniref:Rhomboid family intramembrane serine protease n=1 Tax=Halobacillus seohaensis TaxID=447421 RepID=A0ABW2EI28_9BACI
MYIKQEYYLWKLTYDLVTNHKFDIIYMNTDKSEVWLEREYKGKWHVLRLIHDELNWSNQLVKDIRYVQTQIKQNSRLFRGGKMHLYCIYISEFSPVDELRNLDIKTSKSIHKLHVNYIDDQKKQKEAAELFPTMNINQLDIPLHLEDIEYESQVNYLKQRLLSLKQQKQKENQQVFSYGREIFTFILLAINLILFGLMEWQGDSTSVLTLIEFGAKFNPAILEGEWWRIITSMFLHIGIIHLLMNMLALFYLGMAVERIYGSLRFICIYFLSGIFGGLASFMVNPQIAAGASGAIFGLFGALLFFGLKHKRLFFRTMGYNLLLIIGFNIAFGIFVPQIDNGAHLGGLVGGFIASMIVYLPKISFNYRQLVAALVYGVAISCMILLGIGNGEDENYALPQLHVSQELNEQEKYREVIKITTEAINEPGQYEAELRFNRSYAYTQVNQLSLAKKDLERVLELQPNMAEAHYNLALIYQTEGDLDSARTYAEEASRLQPENEDFQQLTKNLNSVE